MKREYLCGTGRSSGHLLAFASEDALRRYLADAERGEAEELIEHTIYWESDKKKLEFLREEGQFYE